MSWSVFPVLRYLCALLFAGSVSLLNAQVDCLGVNGGAALPGTPCDDGQAFTVGDIWNVDCTCIGYCGGGPFGQAMVGGACDDMDPATVNDFWWPGCICHGFCVMQYGLPGASCDDGSPATNDDIVDQWGCTCTGWQNLITGQVFLDVDLDGVFGGPDMPIQNRTVQAGFSWLHTTTDSNGEFEFRVGPGFYTLLAASGNYDAPAQVNPPIDLSVPGSSSTGNPLAMNPSASLADLAVDLTTTPARPIYRNWITVVCTNEGTLPADGELTLTLDAQQVYEDSYPAGNVVGNTVSWTLPLMQLGETFVAEVRVRTPNGTPLGTSLTYAAQVVAPSDAEPANNTDGFDHQVVGSFDPNDIAVHPALLSSGDIAQGTPVTYTIRFQNTGTWLAENVRIADVLPPLVRPGSFEFVASSHPCHAQLDNSLLEFRFDNIMLPDSNANEPESHGWVMFRVTPQNFLQPGASVGNSASIFFDFNEPVITNTAVFSVELSTGVAEPPREELTLWPNPSTDVLHVSLPPATGPGARLSLVDMGGRTVRRVNTTGQGTVEIPVANLPDGLYAVRLEGAGGGILTRRFLKLR
ncbi:MAG TPA: T9SS type A sorting domain-containing protein [Flavobacteriales bacterium]|nr:T9SS type A sorting domain-containing protein [Flavobacteriales bacterium]HNI03509.1 T9SS type A sorting domain-containing protein [Flavobacteriales bacterium]HNK69487.1 T9SS type A sorting domain-containing protein [Flavobacteriales bacterium]HNK85069.1 T9SS type A sorting domain-containing protein [Flavobacteriales bacterium]